MGLLGSLIFIIGLGAFSIFKVTRFVTGANPLIVWATEKDFYTEEDKIDLTEKRMLFAF